MVLAMSEDIGNGTTKDHIETMLKEYQQRAMRTLAFASQREVDGKWTPLTFDGIVGIADPAQGCQGSYQRLYPPCRSKSHHRHRRQPHDSQ